MPIESIELVKNQQQTVRDIHSWGVATVCAVPTFGGGVESSWNVSLGPMDRPQSVYLIGATWDGVLLSWIRDDPNMIVWKPGGVGREWRFQRRDFVHLTCAEQVLELRGCDSVLLSVFW